MAYAWFLENTVPKVTGETWHVVPMIDIPRHQMHKHKDAAWLFDACGIDPAALLYADEVVAELCFVILQLKLLNFFRADVGCMIYVDLA